MKKEMSKMPREKPGYRDNLESILSFLRNKYEDNRHFLGISDVTEYLGRSYAFVRKHFQINKYGISAESFARLLCS